MNKAVVLQSGGCTAVINQSLCGVVKACKENGIDIYGARWGVEGLIKQDFLDFTIMDDSVITKIGNLPSSFLGSSRIKLDEKSALDVVNALSEKGVSAVFLIGGNDTALNAKFLADASNVLGAEMRIIGIPKTIDNDLPFMHYCPGYGSVARFAAITTQEASLDTLAMKNVDPIKVIEVMGRNAGWIVAASALLKRAPAQGPHLLCFPERPFEWDGFLQKLEDIYKRYGYAVVVISETIRDKDGRRIGEKKDGLVADGFGHPYVESPAQRICAVVEERFKVRARYDKPGTIQRMSMAYVSDRDQRDAFGCGRFAVQLALEGKSGLEVVLKDNGEFSYVDISEIASVERLLPENFINKDGDFITQDFVDYCMPLIGSNVPDFSWAYDLV